VGVDVIPILFIESSCATGQISNSPLFSKEINPLSDRQSMIGVNTVGADAFDIDHSLRGNTFASENGNVSMREKSYDRVI
jgi:hypothetical protein